MIGVKITSESIKRFTIKRPRFIIKLISIGENIAFLLFINYFLDMKFLLLFALRYMLTITNYQAKQ